MNWNGPSRDGVVVVGVLAGLVWLTGVGTGGVAPDHFDGDRLHVDYPCSVGVQNDTVDTGRDFGRGVYYFVSVYPAHASGGGCSDGRLSPAASVYGVTLLAVGDAVVVNGVVVEPGETFESGRRVTALRRPNHAMELGVRVTNHGRVHYRRTGLRERTRLDPAPVVVTGLVGAGHEPNRGLPPVLVVDAGVVAFLGAVVATRRMTAGG